MFETFWIFAEPPLEALMILQCCNTQLYTVQSREVDEETKIYSLTLTPLAEIRHLFVILSLVHVCRLDVLPLSLLIS